MKYTGTLTLPGAYAGSLTLPGAFPVYYYGSGPPLTVNPPIKINANTVNDTSGDEVLLSGNEPTSDVGRRILMGHGISKITDKVYLSDAYSSRRYDRLAALGITHILSIGSEQKPHDNPAFHNLHLNLRDTPTDKGLMEQELNRAVEFIDKYPGPVLIHCFAGISRSATVVVYYLMLKGMSLDQALTRVRTARPIINPNSGFMDLLRKKERQQLGIS
jgi:predicted protein tyrosine phosphatase